MTKAEMNKLVDAAEVAAEALRDALQEQYDEKSEKWQEGDAGQEWYCKIEAAERAIDALSECRPEP